MAIERSDGITATFALYAQADDLVPCRGGRVVGVGWDSRITSEADGGSFLSSGPPATVARGTLAEVMVSVREWLSVGAPA